MITVIILGSGLVVILQSYLTVTNAIQASENYISALRLGQQKTIELEISAYEKNGLFPGVESGNISIAGRSFNWKTEVVEVEDPGYLSANTVLASVSVDWQERSRPKDLVLVNYMPKAKKKKEQTTEE